MFSVYSFTHFLMQKNVSQWFAGASLIIVGVIILSNSSIEKKVSAD